MKIAIKGHALRGKEVIQILESLGGINLLNLFGSATHRYYYICDDNIIRNTFYDTYYKLYTLEEFEKEFPFKIGDKIMDCSDNEIGIITNLICIDNRLYYNVDFVNSGQAFMLSEQLKPYKEMKEERNITLTLDKAKEWYNKGGELKEIALQAFTEKELNPLPRSWEEYCKHTSTLTTSFSSCPRYDAFVKLEHLRDCWWGDWKPEWNASHKYAIKNLQGELTVIGCSNVATFLVFPTGEMAEEFLKCFRDLIEQAGDLI